MTNQEAERKDNGFVVYVDPNAPRPWSMSQAAREKGRKPWMPYEKGVHPVIALLAALVVVIVIIGLVVTRRQPSPQDQAWDHFASQPREVRTAMIRRCQALKAGGMDSLVPLAREVDVAPMDLMKVCTLLQERGAF